eukprot:scaffold39119_cov12-Tisochrysis_lutea.AAC.1
MAPSQTCIKKCVRLFSSAGASVNSRHQLGFGAEDDGTGARDGDEGSSDDDDFFRPKKRTNEVATAHDLAAED